MLELTLITADQPLMNSRNFKVLPMEANQRAALREAPLTREIAIASRHLDLQHNDPADHFIAATAKVLDLILITADKRLMHSQDFKVLPNR